jgi:fumarate reductase subunit C
MSRGRAEAPPSKFWWLRRPKYVAVLLREASSIFILLYVIIYLQLLNQLERGGTAYLGFLKSLGSPPFMAVSLAILAFALYNSITWFLLVPKVQPLRVGGLRIVGMRALAMNLLLLLLISTAVIALILDPSLIPFRFGG